MSRGILYILLKILKIFLGWIYQVISGLSLPLSLTMCYNTGRWHGTDGSAASLSMVQIFLGIFPRPLDYNEPTA